MVELILWFCILRPRLKKLPKFLYHPAYEGDLEKFMAMLGKDVLLHFIQNLGKTSRSEYFLIFRSDEMQYFHCNHRYFIPVTVTVLAEGFDINEKVEDFDNQTPLHAACISGSLPIVHVLVQVQFSPLIALNFEHNVISFVKGDKGMWYFVFCFRWGHISML